MALHGSHSGKTAIRDKKLGMGRGARNTYGKYSSKVPKGEFVPKGNARSGGSAKRMLGMSFFFFFFFQSYDQMSGSQYKQKH